MSSPNPSSKEFSYLDPAEGPDELGRLSGYRILRVLGRGGMGVVFEAEDPMLQRRVAVKVPLGASTDDSYRKRFLREARIAATLPNEHIAAVYQAGEQAGMPFLVMELLRGEGLDRYLEREKTLPVGEALRIAREVAAGLNAAHAKGLVHRDIKPANIWLEEREGRSRPRRVKILDFGVARAAQPKTDITHDGAIVGSPGYLAPEQIVAGALDGRTDLFSLGCVLYQMLTGRLPFKGFDTVALMRAVVLKDHAPAGLAAPHLPASVCQLLDDLLQKEPATRPANAEVVVARIVQIEHDIDPESHKPLPLVEPMEAASGVAGANSVDDTTRRRATTSQTGRSDTTRWNFDNAAGPSADSKPARPRPNSPPWLLIGSLASLVIVGGLLLIWAFSGKASAKGTLRALGGTPRGAVEIKLLRNGNLEKVWDPADDSIELPAGNYQVQERNGFRTYEIDSDHFDLPPGGKVELVIKKRPVQPLKVPEIWPPADLEKRSVQEQMNLVGAELKRRNPGFDYQQPSIWSRTNQGSGVRGVALDVDRTPLKDLAPLKALPNLVQISIVSDSTVNFSGLRGLPLTYLSLEKIPQIDLAPIGTVQSLKTCDLVDIATFDLKQLGNFPGLTSLSLKRCGSISDLMSLKGLLPQLEQLDLSETSVSNLNPLAGMKLTKLSIKQCPEVKELSVLDGLPNLTELECDFRLNYVDAIKKHPKLKRINGELREDFLKESR